MRIKNISSTTIPLPEFQLNLKPGDIGDLSSFDPKLIHTHKMLSVYFEKGLLINLGTVKVSGSKANLQTTRDRIAKLGLGDYVSKPSKKSTGSVREQINAVSKKVTRRPTEPNIEIPPERYKEEYHQNMNPRAEIEAFIDKPKSKVKIQDKFEAVQLRSDGQIMNSFNTPGHIPTGYLAGETTHLTLPIPKSEIKDLDKIDLVDKLGNSHKISLKKIEERLKRKCLGFSSTGKPCKKFAVHFYQTCITHMSESERKEYDSHPKAK